MPVIRWGRLTVLGAIAVAVALPSAAPPAAASAGVADEPASPFTVTADAQVTGSVVDVAFTVGSDGTHAARTATVTLAAADPPATIAPGQITRQVILPDGCVSSCQGEIAIDTAPWTDPGPDPAAPNPTLDENLPQVATVTVTGDPADGTPSATGQSGQFTVDNHRHRIWTRDVQRADTAWDVVVTDSPMTEEPVPALDHVVVSLPGHDDLLTPVQLAAPADAWGTWTGTIDTAAMPYGMWTFRVVGFDADGLATNVLSVPIAVDHGPRFTARVVADTDPVAGTTPMDFGLEVTMTPSPDPYAVPGSLRAYLDGSPDASVHECWCAGPLTRVFAFSGPRLAGGPHTLRVVLTDTVPTDSFGGTRERSTEHAVPLTVDAGPAIGVTTAGQFVADGGTGTVTAKLTAYPGTTLRRWQVDVSAEKVAARDLCPSGTACPTTATVSVPVRVPLTGRQLLTVTVTDSTGTTNQAARHITIDPGTVSRLSAPSPVRYHRQMTLTGRVTTWLGAAAANVPTRLQRRWAGSSTWTTVASGATGTHGYVTFARRAYRNADWRLVTPALPGSWGGSVSGARPVVVRPALTAATGTAQVTAGHSVRVSAWTAPAVAGLRLAVQRRAPGSDVWRTAATPLVDGDGHARALVRLPSRGTWAVRVVRAASRDWGRAVSAALRVTAS